MKKTTSIAPSNAPQLTQGRLRKQACKIFGVGTTVQLFGSGGRVLTSDGRRLEFANMKEWARLIERERPASKAPPTHTSRRPVKRGPQHKQEPDASTTQATTDEGTPKKRALRFIWEML